VGQPENKLVHHPRYATRADAKAAFRNTSKASISVSGVTRASAMFRRRCLLKIQQTTTRGLKQECPLLTVHLRVTRGRVCAVRAVRWTGPNIIGACRPDLIFIWLRS